MGGVIFPSPDQNGIINLLPGELSEQNKRRQKKFAFFAFLYDFAQEYYVRPRIHKADPRRHRMIMKQMISPVKKTRVLDIACGTGGAVVFFDRSNDYTGLDLSYAMLKRAVNKAEKKQFLSYRFILGNAEKLKLDKKSFDVVLIDTALHMIPRYQSVIKETAVVLKKGGVFMCSVPAVGISKEFDAGWKKISAARNLHSLSVSDIQNECSKNGLSFEKFDTNGGVLYFKAYKRE